MVVIVRPSVVTCMALAICSQVVCVCAQSEPSQTSPVRTDGPAGLSQAGSVTPGDPRRSATAPGVADGALPADVAAELKSLDAIQRAMVKSQPIHQWRFEDVRARYQALLKRAGDHTEIEEAIRTRLRGLTQHEEAALAARSFQSILEATRRRDLEIAQVEKKVTSAARAHVRGYNAVGFVQASARSVDGRKLYVLIGKNGSTLAYLDVPPGLEIEPMLARRVGVRGVVHYSEDLNSRLIIVRDVEAFDSRRR
jgi:hypothetical protein